MSECEQTEKQYIDINDKIEQCQKDIDRLFVDNHFETTEIRLDNANKFKLAIGNRVLKNELIDDGNIPVISANVNDVFGKIDKEIINDYSVPYVLWGIDGDWNVRYIEKGYKFYPTDHCGYIKVLDKNVNPIYLSKMIEIEGKKQRFSRSNRASTDRVSSLIVKLPNIEIQNKIANEITDINHKIIELKKSLINCENKTIEIVEGYLK